MTDNTEKANLLMEKFEAMATARLKKQARTALENFRTAMRSPHGGGFHINVETKLKKQYVVENSDGTYTIRTEVGALLEKALDPWVKQNHKEQVTQELENFIKSVENSQAAFNRIMDYDLDHNYRE